MSDRLDALDLSYRLIGHEGKLDIAYIRMQGAGRASGGTPRRTELHLDSSEGRRAVGLDV